MSHHKNSRRSKKSHKMHKHIKRGRMMGGMSPTPGLRRELTNAHLPFRRPLQRSYAPLSASQYRDLRNFDNLKRVTKPLSDEALLDLQSRDILRQKLSKISKKLKLVEDMPEKWQLKHGHKYGR